MPNIVVLAQNGHYGCAALTALDSAWPSGTHVVAVVEGILPGQQTGMAQHLWRWVAGTQDVWPLAQKPNDLSIFARRRGARHVQVTTLRLPKLLPWLLALGVDTLVCAGFMELVPAAWLNHFSLALNAHPSLLPCHRGPSPIFWWLKSGSPDTGVDVHHMVARADEGPCLARLTCAPPVHWDGALLATTLGSMAGQLLARVLDQSLRGLEVARPQLGRSSWAPRPRPEDAFVVPSQWRCAQLMRFCCGAGYWRTPRIKAGGELFFVRFGLAYTLGARLPGDYALAGDVLQVPCADGTLSVRLQR